MKIKYEQAIKLLEMLSSDEFQQFTSSEFDDAIYMAIKALEKRIPKEPIHKDGEIICPNCLGALIYSMHSFKGNYCDECGQAIDWSAEE